MQCCVSRAAMLGDGEFFDFSNFRCIFAFSSVFWLKKEYSGGVGILETDP